MDEAFDTVQAAAVAGLYFTRVPGNCHVNARQLIGGRRVDGEEAIAAESAEIVQRSLAGEAHDEIGGGDVAFEADEFYAAVPERGEREADLVNKRRVVAVERGLHALDRARRGSPGGFVEAGEIGARTDRRVTLLAGQHQIKVKVTSAGHEREVR